MMRLQVLAYNHNDIIELAKDCATLATNIVPDYTFL